MAMTKSELMRAFREAASYEFRDIPNDDSQIQHDFSLCFLSQMERILTQQQEQELNVPIGTSQQD